MTICIAHCSCIPAFAHSSQSSPPTRGSNPAPPRTRAIRLGPGRGGGAPPPCMTPVLPNASAGCWLAVALACLLAERTTTGVIWANAPHPVLQGAGGGGRSARNHNQNAWCRGGASGGGGRSTATAADLMHLEEAGPACSQGYQNLRSGATLEPQSPQLARNQGPRANQNETLEKLSQIATVGKKTYPWVTDFGAQILGAERGTGKGRNLI